jgi:hypothetical protein
VVRGNVVRRLLDPRRGRVVREVRTALANREAVPLRRQLAAWRHGFYAETSRWYDFETYGFDAYVSDYARAGTLASINENRHILDDKVMTYLYLSHMGLPTPTLHGFIREGEIVWLGGQDPPPGGLDGLLERRGKLVVKSRAGSGGSEFVLLHREAGTTYANGRAVEDPRQALGRGSLVISDFVEQHDRLAAIYPNTTNTMRLLTFTDVDTGEPFVAAATHRFGTKRSEPVDNVAAGGLSGGIDLETGVLRRVMYQQRASDGSTQDRWIEDHPDSGARITGTKIPHWQSVLDGALRAAAALPGSPCIGWDAVVTRDGFCIIEGNNRADVNMQIQVGPLLLDDRVRKILASTRRRAEASDRTTLDTAPTRRGR